MPSPQFGLTTAVSSPTDIATNPPNYEMSINNRALNVGVRKLIQQVEFESSDGMADMLRIDAIDPIGPDGKMTIVDSKIFTPGNRIALFGGYGWSLTHIGSVVVRKARPVFPSDGHPRIQVVGYSRDAEMADNAPLPPSDLEKETLKAEAAVELGASRVRGTPQTGRRFADSKWSDAVRARAEAYGFKTDIDETPDSPRDYIQKVGLSDYDFIQGIANITGFYFWVDADSDGKWTLHFKDPDKAKPGDFGQEKEYTFKYNEGDFSTVETFEPELAVQGSSTTFKAVAKSSVSGKTIEATVQENETAEDFISKSGGTSFDLQSPPRLRDISTDLYTGELGSSAAVKLYIGDFSFEVKASRNFRDADELARWARVWWKRNRENFIQARVALLGIETMRARQVHSIAGVGVAYSGRYTFSRVRHVFNANGYHLDCNVRKIVSTPAPEASLAYSPPPGGFTRTDT